jgi:hypothetical protein
MLPGWNSKQLFVYLNKTISLWEEIYVTYLFVFLSQGILKLISGILFHMVYIILHMLDISTV